MSRLVHLRVPELLTHRLVVCFVPRLFRCPTHSELELSLAHAPSLITCRYPCTEFTVSECTHARTHACTQISLRELRARLSTTVYRIKQSFKSVSVAADEVAQDSMFLLLLLLLFVRVCVRVCVCVFFKFPIV